MKIGILTYHYSDNYGALLQTYSLSKLLEKKGFNVEIINLVPDLTLKRKVVKFFKDALTKNFKEFRNKHIKTFPNRPLTFKSLRNTNFNNYDAIIVGSDQVWRKSYTEGLGYSYFLDFVPKGVKRIAYAASFGLDYYEGNKKDIAIVKKELQKFDLITNREVSGVKICKDLFNIESYCVLDPVLLADEKTFVFEYFKQEKSFITQYLLDPNQIKIEFVEKISKKLKQPIKINYKNSQKKITLLNSIFDRKNETFPSVYDWIQGIKNSEFVITDSFHGVAFSILFNKQFVCIINEKRGKTRMIGLLKQLGLENMSISDEDLYNFDIEKIKTIDYTKVNSKLNELKNKSISILLQGLNNSKLE